MPAVPVAHRVGPHVRMVDRHILPLRESEAEQPARGVEGGRRDVVERQVGLDFGLVEVVARLADLLGVEAPIVRLELEVAALARDFATLTFALPQTRSRSSRTLSGDFAIVSSSL